MMLAISFGWIVLAGIVLSLIYAHGEREQEVSQ